MERSAPGAAFRAAELSSKWAAAMRCLSFHSEAVESMFQVAWKRQQVRSSDVYMILGHGILDFFMLLKLWQLRSQHPVASAINALVIVLSVVKEACMMSLLRNNPPAYLHYKRWGYCWTILVTPIVSGLFMIAGGRIEYCKPPTPLFWLLELNSSIAPATILHASVFRLPFPMALAVNGVCTLGLMAVSPAICAGSYQTCPAGTATKQRVVAWMRSAFRQLPTWASVPPRATPWPAAAAALAAATSGATGGSTAAGVQPGWLTDCAALHNWWLACAFILNMHLLYSWERLERLRWASRLEVSDDLEPAVAAAEWQMERAARPRLRLALELAAAGVAAWQFVDAMVH